MTEDLGRAIGIIEAILTYNEVTALGLNDLYEVRKGNKSMIMEYLKAINSITSTAIKDLEKLIESEVKDNGKERESTINK